MNFEHSAKVKDLLARLTAFMAAHVYPNERRIQKQEELEEFKARAPSDPVSR